MVSSTFLLLLISTVVTRIRAQNFIYKPVQVYEGAGFFDSENWDWFTEADPTHGLVEYIPFEEANATALAGTISGGPADGGVYLGVDFTNKSPEGRRSVRLATKRTFGQHLMIADIYHAPAICGTWQTLWALGPEWPNGGEIDYLESVHDSPANRMSLHTKDSLMISNHSAYMKGSLETNNCAVDEENIGCTVLDSSESASSGSKFNENLGGVFASEFTSKGIQIWFFPRSSIPADITSGTPVPSEAWGKPSGMFMADGVDWDSFFKNLKIVINTTFCGDWAGKVWATSPCGSLAPTCEEYVANNPEVFKDAYWAIKTLRVYEQMLAA